MKILNWIAKLLKNFPVKSIFITIIVVVLLVFGVRNVFMATGNDTLVKTDSDVYRDNSMLEKEFGGESIIVLYESDDLLTPAHLEHMKGLENTLQTTDSIYSIISPVTLVEEIASKQSDTFQEGIVDVIDGLYEMGSQLSDIGEEIKESVDGSPDMEFPEIGHLELPEMGDPELPEFGGLELPESGELELPDFRGFKLPEIELPEFGDIPFPDMEEQMEELDKAFSGMIEAQENLGGGTENLVGGYAQFGEQLNNVGQKLLVMANQVDSPQKEQLLEVSEQITFLSEQMTGISEDTNQLPMISEQTIEGLNNIRQKLNEQVQEQMQMIDEQQEQQAKMEAELEKKQEQMKKEMKEQQEAQQEDMKKEIEDIQEAEEEKMKKEMQKQQEALQEDMKAEMEEAQDTQKNEMKAQMKEQQAAKEKVMEEIKDDMQEKQEEQAEMLTELSEGLSTMGEKLQTISENMETIYGYRDIMTPGLPEKQSTLDNMIYDDDGELRPMFEEVIVDDQHMLMMIKFKGDTDDTEKSEIVETINNYLDTESIDSAETLVSGKPVLDNAIRSSMQENIQKMMGLALLIMIVVLFFVFKVHWRLLPLLTVLIAVIGTVGIMGWLQIPITMVSMAVFPILIGLGIDYAIQFQNRYAEESLEEDSNESE